MSVLVFNVQGHSRPIFTSSRSIYNFYHHVCHGCVCRADFIVFLETEVGSLKVGFLLLLCMTNLLENMKTDNQKWLSNRSVVL